MIYLTSDTHFFHKRIANFQPLRGGRDHLEMTENIVRYWNAVVDATDTIYHLGDFSFGNSAQTRAVIKRLKGIKILVMGNHDKHSVTWYRKAGFEKVYKHYVDLVVDGVKYRLSHYPYKLKFWERIYYGIFDRSYTRYQERKHEPGNYILLHGHYHGKRYSLRDNAVDVSWDAWHCLPGFDSIRQVMTW